MNSETTLNLNMDHFRKRLRELIKVQFGSVSAFAESTGLKLNTLYRILNVDTVPTLHVLLVVCESLGCSLDFLLGVEREEDDPCEAYAAAARNILIYRSRWNRAKILYLVFAALDMLTEEEDRKLRVFLNLDGPESCGQKKNGRKSA